MTAIEKETAIEERVPWKIILPFTIVFTAIATFVGGMLPGVHAFWTDFAGNTTGGLTFTPGPFFVIVLTYFLFMAIPELRKKVPERVLVYLFASAGITAILSSFRIWSSMETFYHARVDNPIVRGQYVPALWFPSKAEIEKSFYPNMPFSSEWYAPMTFSWMLLPILLNVYLLMWTTLLRRQWVDVERLTFPYATPVTYLIKYHYGTSITGEKRRFSPRTLMLVFFVLGILYNLPPMLSFTFTWFPDLYRWATWPYTFWVPGCEIVASDPAFTAITSRVAGFWAMNVNLVWAALIFFSPASTLLTTMVIWFIILVATQIAATLGYYPGWETAGWRGFQYGPPLFTGAISMGLVIGIVLWWALFNRKYLGTTVRLAMGQSTSEEKVWESEEPMSYRKMYLSIVALFILLYIVMGAGSELWRTAPLLIIFTTINMIALSRVHAFAPFYLGATGGYSFTHGETKWMTPLLGYPEPMTEDAKTTEYLFTHNWLARPMTGEEGGFPFFGSVFYQGPAYKMAKDANIHSKNMFKVILVSIVVALIVGTVVAVFMWNGYGLMSLPVNKEWDKLSTGDVPEMNSSPGPSVWWEYGIFGIVLMGVTYYMHSRFLWFWLDPAGLIIGFSNYFDERITFLPVLIAWVAKYIIFKIGGTKLYEDVGVPCGIGFLSGFAALAMLNNIAAVLKFYIPY